MAGGLWQAYGKRITAVWQRGWKTAVWRKLGRSYGVGITGGIGGMGGIGIGGIGGIGIGAG